MATILSSMCANVRNYVSLLSNTSEFFDVSLGVKHGEPLSPILFMLTIEFSLRILKQSYRNCLIT